MNKENCALKLVDEIILYYDARSKETSNFDLYSDHLQGARSFLVKVTEFKITKNIKGPLWQCGSLHVVCMYGVLCGGASWSQTYISTQKAILLLCYLCSTCIIYKCVAWHISQPGGQLFRHPWHKSTSLFGRHEGKETCRIFWNNGVDVFGSDCGPLTCWLENFNKILDWKKLRELLQILSIY